MNETAARPQATIRQIAEALKEKLRKLGPGGCRATFGGPYCCECPLCLVDQLRQEAHKLCTEGYVSGLEVAATLVEGARAEHEEGGKTCACPERIRRHKELQMPEQAKDAVKHVIKSWPENFEPMLRGEKTYEIRKGNDRIYEVGDFVQICEVYKASGGFTGRSVIRRITHVMNAGVLLPPDTWVFAIADPGLKS